MVGIAGPDCDCCGCQILLEQFLEGEANGVEVVSGTWTVDEANSEYDITGTGKIRTIKQGGDNGFVWVQVISHTDGQVLSIFPFANDSDDGPYEVRATSGKRQSGHVCGQLEILKDGVVVAGPLNASRNFVSKYEETYTGIWNFRLCWDTDRLLASSWGESFVTEGRISLATGIELDEEDTGRKLAIEVDSDGELFSINRIDWQKELKSNDEVCVDCDPCSDVANTYQDMGNASHAGGTESVTDRCEATATYAIDDKASTITPLAVYASEWDRLVPGYTAFCRLQSYNVFTGLNDVLVGNFNYATLSIDGTHYVKVEATVLTGATFSVDLTVYRGVTQLGTTTKVFATSGAASGSAIYELIISIGPDGVGGNQLFGYCRVIKNGIFAGSFDDIELTVATDDVYYGPRITAEVSASGDPAFVQQTNGSRCYDDDGL